MTWFRRPLGKLLLRASLTKLETELVVKPRPNIPVLLREFAVLRELLALVLCAPPPPPGAPEARRRATAAKVSRSEAGPGARCGKLGSEGGGGSAGSWSHGSAMARLLARLGTLTLVSLSVSVITT